MELLVISVLLILGILLLIYKDTEKNKKESEKLFAEKLRPMVKDVDTLEKAETALKILIIECTDVGSWNEYKKENSPFLFTIHPGYTQEYRELKNQLLDRIDILLKQQKDGNKQKMPDMQK